MKEINIKGIMRTLRRTILIMLTTCMFLSGCSAIDKKEKPADAEEKTVEETNQNDEPAADVANVAESEVIADGNTDDGDVKDVNDDDPDMSQDKKYLQDKKDVTGAYTAFLNNEKEAVFDYPTDQSLWFEYENGNSVGIQELQSELLKGAGGVAGSGDGVSNVEDYRYIDCGCDGEYELLVIISLNKVIRHYTFVLKEVDDKLFIRYILPEGERSEVSISDYGYVNDFGKGSADLAIMDYGFLDKDVRYHDYYSCWYYLSLQDDRPDGFENIDIDDKWENIQLLIYYLGGNRENGLYEMYDIDKDTDLVDTIYSEPLTSQGIKLYTEDEIQARLGEYAEEIGLDKKVIPKEETESSDSDTTASIQNEIAEIETKYQEYEDLDWACMPQQPANITTYEMYKLWDDELNSIWSRLVEEVTPEKKEELLANQREWIKKKEASVKAAGEEAEGGTLQPQLENGAACRYTRKRVYYLASVLADTRGESFKIPVKVEESFADFDLSLDEVFSKFEGQWVFDVDRGACIGVEKSQET